MQIWLLPAGGYAFLGALMKGATLAEATRAAAAAATDFDLTENLETLINSRVCIGPTISPCWQPDLAVRPKRDVEPSKRTIEMIPNS